MVDSNSSTQRVSGESPFKPGYDDYVSENPGRGSLKVQISVADEALPIKDVFVDVALIYKGKRYSIYHDTTDSSGIVNEIVLPSKLGGVSLDPETAGENDAQYLVSAYHPGFCEISDMPVTIFDRIETILPITLSPETEGR